MESKKKKEERNQNYQWTLHAAVVSAQVFNANTRQQGCVEFTYK